MHVSIKTGQSAWYGRMHYSGTRFNKPRYNEDPVMTKNIWKPGRITVRYVETNPAIKNRFWRSRRTIYPAETNILKVFLNLFFSVPWCFVIAGFHSVPSNACFPYSPTHYQYYNMGLYLLQLKLSQRKLANLVRCQLHFYRLVPWSFREPFLAFS